MRRRRFDEGMLKEAGFLNGSCSCSFSARFTLSFAHPLHSLDHRACSCMIANTQRHHVRTKSSPLLCASHTYFRFLCASRTRYFSATLFMRFQPEVIQREASIFASATLSVCSFQVSCSKSKKYSLSQLHMPQGSSAATPCISIDGRFGSIRSEITKRFFSQTC
jgi:hypothetical protein